MHGSNWLVYLSPSDALIHHPLYLQGTDNSRVEHHLVHHHHHLRPPDSTSHDADCQTRVCSLPSIETTKNVDSNPPRPSEMPLRDLFRNPFSYTTPRICVTRVLPMTANVIRQKRTASQCLAPLSDRSREKTKAIRIRQGHSVVTSSSDLTLPATSSFEYLFLSIIDHDHYDAGRGRGRTASCKLFHAQQTRLGIPCCYAHDVSTHVRFLLRLSIGCCQLIPSLAHCHASAG